MSGRARSHGLRAVLFRSRVGAGRVVAVVRIAAGAVFLVFGVVKFALPEFERAEFVRFGLPDSIALVYLVGLLETVGGLMLVLGLLTRIAAAALALNMTGAVLTAGLAVGGPVHLGLAPALLVAMIFILWTGPGGAAVDNRLDGSG